MPRKTRSDEERKQRDAELRTLRQKLEALEQELHELWLLLFEDGENEQPEE